MSDEKTLQEIHAEIFGAREPKFAEGEVAYQTNPVYPNHFFKVVVLRDNGEVVNFRTQHLLDSAIAPHYGNGRGGQIVKADEVPADGIKLEW